MASCAGVGTARALLLAIALALAAACALGRAVVGVRNPQRATAAAFLARADPAEAASSRRLAESSLQFLAIADRLPQGAVAFFKQSFLVFDKNEDGAITAPELDAVKSSIGARLKDALDQVDVDGDGTIGFHEFLLFLRVGRRKVLETGRALMEACAVADRDNDGFISRAEFVGILENLGETLTDKEIDQAMREADANSDSKVNCREFVARFGA